MFENYFKLFITATTKAETLTKKRKRTLLNMVFGNLRIFNSLVDLELRKNSKLNFSDAIQAAIETYRDDIRRN